jgi:bifunctional DNase/RNase
MAARKQWRTSYGKRAPTARQFARKHVVIGSVVIAIIIIASATYLAFGGSAGSVLSIPELSTNGYSQVLVGASIDSHGEGVVTLTSGCSQIRAHVEAAQAESIYSGMEGMTPARPNAHDIAADAFRSLGIDVLMVKVTRVENQTFYGRIILRNGNTIASLDARPSDATAIAVRMQVPIYVKDELLEQNGQDICTGG